MTTCNKLELILSVSLLLCVGTVVAHTGPINTSFEVATVKPSPPLDRAKTAADIRAGKMPRLGAHITRSQADFIYMNLIELISYAYKVEPYQITGPPWLAKERFDIMAKMPDGATRGDAPRFLQALLADRFKLASHRETQERAVLALMVSKNGPNLQESPIPPPAPVDPNAPPKPGEITIDSPDGPVRISRNSDGSMTFNRGTKGVVTQRMNMGSRTVMLECKGVTMGGLADTLTQILQAGAGGGRPVVDQTGLTGAYDATLELSLDDLMAIAHTGGGSGDASGLPEASDPGGAGGSVYSSIKKLGLELKPSKAEAEQLIIDHVEKTPTEN